MSAASTITWQEANQRDLMRMVGAIREVLLRKAGISDVNAPGTAGDEDTEPLDPPSALERLCAAFGLSAFERDILLLCVGVELDSEFAQIVASAQGDPRRTQPSFGLALAALSDPHWSALSPMASLRRWRLIELGSGERLTSSPLRIDERVLHYLAGVSYLDERLAAMVKNVPAPAELPSSQQAQVEFIVQTWSAATRELPVVLLCGDNLQPKRAVAAAACSRLGLGLYVLPVSAVPQHAAELEAFARLWQREAALAGVVLLIESSDVDSAEAAREVAVTRLLDEIQGPLFFSSRARRTASRRPLVLLDIGKPTAAEQRTLWQRALGPAAGRLNGGLDILGAQFDLDSDAIRHTCAEALQGADADELETRLWDLCRGRSRPQVSDLAERITPAATWDDLVLPEAQKSTLREIATHIRHRGKVYEEWGFAATGSRGLGISALFHGLSGTGKTMAAEVLAHELRLDLYRIDLSRVVSKYIGETEGNLRRIFDAAEGGGAILLFDEADALFGKRSEVKDSHDRYANIEVSYLLQRMEAYRGLAILTTNMKNALDQAFLRRLRFVVQFPFPDAEQRAEIWRRAFPPQTPINGLDYARLARLQVSGGNIRSMAMNAAFLAAESARPVDMAHLLQAARGEYAKLERPLTEIETGGRR
jgi:AAA+ superfamily predicted ATPase